MSEIISFGEWVQTRRTELNYSRKVFADLVGCAPITVKKIERDERRPSVEMAELIAIHLRVPEPEQNKFVRRARGEYVPNFMSPYVDKESPQTVSIIHPSPLQLDRFEVLNRLTPLPDQKLFGVEEIKNRILPILKDADRPWIVSLDGIGGIGKTTMAHTLVNHLLDTDEYDDYGWVSAKQEEFSGRGIRTIQSPKPALDDDSLVTALLIQLSNAPYPVDSLQAKRIALREILQKKRCLIVIDNLETVTDYESLLPLLRHLANPSKFVLTSRMSLKFESDVVSESLSELAWPDARALLKHEGEAQGLPQLQSASEGLLKEIYQTAGGNPLALKLVIGQTHFLPIDQVLAGLRLAQTRQSDQLYHYIYREAWEMLDQNARKLWVSMPIVPNGTFEQLTVASQLSEFDVQGALADLNAMSLVEIGPGEPGPRYKLHRLTETFLMHEVIKWQLNDDQANRERHFFKGQVGAMVQHWQNDTALADSDSEKLDQEREGILKAIHLALSIPEGWQGTKELILALTRYMERRGNWQDWQRTLEVAIDVAKTVQDQPGEIRMLGLLGRILIRQNKTNDVIKNYRKVIRLTRETGDKVEEARACSNLGYTLIEKEQFWRAETLCCHALDLFGSVGHQHGLAHTNNHLGVLYIKLNEWEKGKNHLEAACDIWKQIDDLAGYCSGIGNFGLLYNEMNQPRDAIGYLDEQIQISKKTGDQGAAAIARLNLAISHEKLAEYEIGLRYIEEAEKYFKEHNNLFLLFDSWRMIGTLKARMGDNENAEHFLESALSGFIELGNKIGQASVESSFLKMYLDQNDENKAKEKTEVLKGLFKESPFIAKSPLVFEALSGFDGFPENRFTD